MAKPTVWQPPTGRIGVGYRSFTEIVRDMRYCVFSIIRLRPDGSGQAGRFLTMAIGTGFFVGPSTLLTCNHVINSPNNPHVPGDGYVIVQNLGSGMVKVSRTCLLTIGQNLHLFSDCDLAIIQFPAGDPQPYATVGYNNIPEGAEIGIAGYPLSQISAGPNGEPQFPGIIYRIAKGVVTSPVMQSIEPRPNPRTKPLNTIEVNFLFVPGNSGGPIFDAETGRVMAFVHGFTNREIVQNYVNTNVQNTAFGAPDKHIQSLHATYSPGIKMDSVRQELE